MGEPRRTCARFHADAVDMAHLHKDSFQFLTDLGENNNRAWFEANKPRFLDVKADFETLIDALLAKISIFDPTVAHLQAKNCVFRIYRDTRFSKDKQPYKTNLGAHMLSGGRQNEKNSAGYFIHISPGDCFLAGGAHRPPADWMAAIRDDISTNGAELRKIIGAKNFKTYFGEIEGERLKTAPRGIAKDHPEIDLLRYKSFLAVHRMKDGVVTSNAFLAHATKVFKAVQPFDQFLNRRILQNA